MLSRLEDGLSDPFDGLDSRFSRFIEPGCEEVLCSGCREAKHLLEGKSKSVRLGGLGKCLFGQDFVQFGCLLFAQMIWVVEPEELSSL